MYTLGIAGGINPIYSNMYGYGIHCYHDSACVLLENGNVVCAIEEERLNRIKHSNKFPCEAIKYCLASRGLAMDDIAMIAVNVSNDAAEGSIPGAFCASLFERDLGVIVGSDKFRFVHHHYAHAMSTYGCSGFSHALVATFDGLGEGFSGITMRASGSELEQIDGRSIRDSMGFFYLWITELLGFKIFDEYKVMGLAPYGNPAIYRDVFSSLYQLLPNGAYTVCYESDEHLKAILAPVLPQRKPHEPITQFHQDVAASLQEALEVVIFHVLRHWQKQTGERNLCLAGGVAHNCVVNGKLVRSGLFDNVFVQPASHDAGGALGAGLYTYYAQAGSKYQPTSLSDVYWGREIPKSDEIEARLSDWKDFIQFEKRTDFIADTAKMLADGQVIGWVQGRSEFGPRALGNRSILADPRPAINKDRINAMVKKREAFRPFAPAVPAELADRYFDVCSNLNQFAFMTYTMEVKPDMREILGAVTHVNGTARLQTVNRETNERFWRLLMEFGEITGVSVLLNTSFNNNAEPIVETVDDALGCFLTTGLDALVIDDFLITKKPLENSDRLKMAVKMRPFVSLHRTLAYNQTRQWAVEYKIHVSYDFWTLDVSENVFKVLVAGMSDAQPRPLADVIASIDGISSDEAKAVLQELTDLWSRRLVVFVPAND
jgi:carbamoyltransferase